MSKRMFGRFCLAVFLAPLALTGCSKGYNKKITESGVSISGTVYQANGEVLPGGMLIFEPAGQVGAQGSGSGFRLQINADGTYKQSNIAAGDYVVAIDTESMRQRIEQAEQEKNRPLQKDEPERGDPYEKLGLPKGVKAVQIPAQYANRATSPLKVTIAAGENTKDFKLE